MKTSLTSFFRLSVAAAVLILADTSECLAQTPGKIVVYSEVETVSQTNLTGDITSSAVDWGKVAPLPGPNGDVAVLQAGAQDTIYLGGAFTTYNGIQRIGIARVTNNGALVSSFGGSANGVNAGGKVNAIALQSDGKVIIGGSFSSYNGVARVNLARLNEDGTLDSSFPVSPLDPEGAVHAIALFSDGSIVVAGEFAEVQNSVQRGRVAKLSATGVLDTTFASGAGFDGTVRCLNIGSDGSVICGGDFTAYDGQPASKLAKLTSSGALDTSFASAVGADGSVRCLLRQADNKIVFGGDFQQYNGAAASRVARVDQTGLMDNTFNIGAGPDGSVMSMAAQTSLSRIVLAGAFQNVGTKARNRFAAITSSGAVVDDPPANTADTSPYFEGGAGADGAILAVTTLAENYLALGGVFTSFQSKPRGKLVVANPNGLLIPDFNYSIKQEALVAFPGVSSISFQPVFKRYWVLDVQNRRHSFVYYYTLFGLKRYKVATITESLPIISVPIKPEPLHQWTWLRGGQDFLKDSLGNPGQDISIDPLTDPVNGNSGVKDTWGISAGTYCISGKAFLQPIVTLPKGVAISSLPPTDTAVIPSVMNLYGMAVENTLSKNFGRQVKRKFNYRFVGGQLLYDEEIVDTDPTVRGDQPFEGNAYTRFASKPTSSVWTLDKVMTAKANETQAAGLVLLNNPDPTPDLEYLPRPVRTLENGLGHIMHHVQTKLGHVYVP